MCEEGSTEARVYLPIFGVNVHTVLPLRVKLQPLFPIGTSFIERERGCAGAISGKLVLHTPQLLKKWEWGQRSVCNAYRPYKPLKNGNEILMLESSGWFGEDGGIDDRFSA